MVKRWTKGDEAFAALHLRHEKMRGFAAIEAIGTVGSDALEGGCQLGLAPQMADWQGFSVEEELFGRPPRTGSAWTWRP